MFLFFLIQSSIAIECTKFGKDYLKIVAQKDENLYYPITNAFNDWRDFSEYELIDLDNQIQLIQPIQLLQIGIIDTKTQNYKIIQFHGIQKIEKFWLNQYAILRIINNKYQLIYSFQQSYNNQDRIPEFDYSIDLGDINMIKCFDFVWMTRNSLIIDCMQIDSEDHKNYFYLIQLGDQIQITRQLNLYPYSQNQERNLQIQEEYFYRVTKMNQYDNKNQVEIYQYNHKTLEISFFINIDSQFFIDQNFTDIYQDYANLNILDFKCGEEEGLSFLDTQQNVIYLSFDKKWTLHIYHSQFKILSFDFDFQNKQFIGVGESFLYNSKYPESQLNFPFSTISHIPYYTQDFIILVSSKQIIQIMNTYVNFIKLGDFSQVSIDSRYNDMLSIQGNQIMRLLNLNYVQLLYHPIDDIDLGIHQAQVNYKGCTLNIEYQTIETNSKKLITVRKDESMFWKPFFASSIYQYNYFSTPVQGPNINIEILDEENHVSDNFQTPELERISLTGESVSDYVYIDILEFKKNYTRNLMVITQNNNLLLTFKSCELLIVSFSCSKVKEVQLDFQLTKEITSITLFMEYFYIISLISQEQLSVITYYLTEDSLESQLIQLQKDQEIDSFVYFQFTLVLCSSKQEKIYVYQMMQEMTLSQIISSKDYKYLKPTKPFVEQVETSKQIPLFFLFNKQDQLLLYFFLDQSSYYGVKQIQLYNVENVKILFFKDKFVLIQEKVDKQFEILIYNKYDISNIYLEKYLPLYFNKIDNLENVAISLNLDALYLITQNKLLIYLVNNPAHNSLFKEITFEQRLEDLIGTNIYVMFFQNKELFIHSFSTQLYFSYSASLNEDIYIKVQNTSVQFSNNQEKLLINQKFKYVNMNTQLQIFPEKLKIKTKLRKNVEIDMIQDMGSNWYQGQVIQFQLNNGIPDQKVSIISPIEENQHIFVNYSRAIENYDYTKLFVLSDFNYGLIEKSSGNLVKKFEFLDEQFKCGQILYSVNQMFIVSCIKDGRDTFIFGISCNGDVCYNSQGLSMLGALKKLFLFETTLFCVGQDFMSAFGLSTSILEIERSIYFGSIYIDSDSFSNTIIMVKSNHFDLYQFNFNQQLTIREFKILDNTLIEFNQLYFDAYEYLNRDYYLDQQIVEIKVLSTSLQDDIFEGKFLFFVSQGAHYGMRFNFTCKDSGCIINNQEVLFIVQGYENFELFDKKFPTIRLENDTLLLLYQDLRGGSKFLATYRIPQTFQKNFPITFFGALEFKNQFYRVEKQLIFYKFNNKEHILFNNNNSSILTIYDVNKSPLLIYNGIMEQKQYHIKVQNHYKSEQLQIYIEEQNIRIYFVSDDVIPYLIAVLIFFDFFFYVIYRCHKKKKVRVDSSFWEKNRNGE